jgi:NitT/TauT family transport system substrate-binding protein
VDLKVDGMLLRRFLCVAALASAALIVPVPALRAQPAPITLHVAASPVDDVMPVLYAQRAGLFQQAGLNVVLDRGNGGAAISAAVVSGSVDIGKGNIIPIIAAHAHDVPLVVIAPAAIYDPRTPDAVLVVKKDAPISSAHDLEGKILGVTALSDLNVLAVQAWMESNRADWKSLKFIEVPYPALVPALSDGRVQAVVLIKPFITDAVDSGKAKILALSYSAVGPRFLESVWFANRSFVDSHREAVATFARIVAQASTYTNAHQSETVDLLASWTGLDPQRAAQSPRIVTGTVLEAREIQPVIDVAAKYGLIAKAFDAHEIMPR